ncbi:formate dehydrogenase subunit gamma [Loktanella sp. D2R18]|uniref:formate dehydrogenase subunit gamma n=1 Tax=Yoonia sp. 1_MG-2023 TaxID=3062659 RepID=UPI000DEB617A|nr:MULTISPECIES: formate dehydrogenase subunit gamma [Rhodobacterales]MDO6591532.1 formate dehydrogenase subunit gamma [Yoonia sp. 1_MG-2023]RBW43893.1 formate dehydrogenase subunit gamma [Loktanella sp. D2R18]
MRAYFASLIICLFALGAQAQDVSTPDRSATGGAQTLADIMARQDAQAVDDAFRSENTGDPSVNADSRQALGTRGGQSDPDLWRALRYDSADVTTQSRSPASDVLIQDSGMWWLTFREGPLLTYGGFLLLGTLALLGLFYLLRGRIRIDGAKTGRTVTRFKSIERFAHWLMGGAFVLLGITGLVSLFGRKFIIPTFGHDSFALVALASKWVHNNVSWAFMIGLIMVFFMWVLENIPNKHDLRWIAVGGGLMSKGVHPPAKKFNAGQKVIFWSVILFGASISVSGLSLLFPFELPMFAKTFTILNATGLPQMLGFDLPMTLTPQAEMQYAQLWHAIMAFILMAIVIAHIYIGSVGMEGAYDAMGSGEVEEQWAREHHSLWLAEVQAKQPDTPPAQSER